MYEVCVVRNRIDFALEGDVMLVFLLRLWIRTLGWYSVVCLLYRKGCCVHVADLDSLRLLVHSFLSVFLCCVHF